MTGIAIDAARQAFVGTLVAFAEEHGCEVIAEGVETEEERWSLADAGVHLGQGYLLGRPRSGAVHDEQVETEVVAGGRARTASGPSRWATVVGTPFGVSVLGTERLGARSPVRRTSW